MPSLSTFAHFTLANLGPLTTPYTAAPACATAGVTAGAPAQLHMVGQIPSGVVGEPRCPNDTGPLYAEGCWPSATRAASLAAALTGRTTTTTTEGPFFTDEGPMPTAVYRLPPKLAEYFSPGVRCPAGWTTAGTVAWADTTTPTPTPTGDGTAAQARTLTAGPLLLEGDGVFSAAVNYTWRPTWDLYYRKGEALAHALEPSETLAFCCPSDYEGYDNGVCVSTLGPAADVGFTEVCWRGPASGRGTSITTGPMAVTAAHGPFGSVTGSLTGYTYTPAVPLVYRASDLAAATAPTTTDGSAPTGTGAAADREGGANETPLPNAGRRNAPGEGVLSWGWVATALLPLVTGAGAMFL